MASFFIDQPIFLKIATQTETFDGYSKRFWRNGIDIDDGNFGEIKLTLVSPHGV
jgi:hypothetical protein